MKWEDIIKTPKKIASVGRYANPKHHTYGKHAMIQPRQSALWLLNALVEPGANVDEEIEDFIEKYRLDDEETKELENIIQVFLQAHKKAHAQIVSMDWKVDTKRYPQDKYYDAGE